MSETNPVKEPCKIEAVNNWLRERNQIIVTYCKLTGSRNNNSLPNIGQINLFCDLLIDYVSAGHFEVYEKIVESCDVNGSSSMSLLEKLYPQITDTTDIVVNFNDKYSQFNEESPLKQFDDDLSLLGEAIAKRVDLEDTLIETLNDNH